MGWPSVVGGESAQELGFAGRGFGRGALEAGAGEAAMGAVEKGVEIFQIFREQGLGGLWQMLVEKLGGIKEMILEQVKDFVITKIITAHQAMPLSAPITCGLNTKA